MELLPKEVREQLPPLYAQENEHDPLVYVKYFHPLSSWTWYATEGAPDGEDFLFFGWVNGDFPELGYFSLHEMQEVQVMGLGIERDLHFQPTRLSEVKKLHAERPASEPHFTPPIIVIFVDETTEETDSNGNV